MLCGRLYEEAINEALDRIMAAPKETVKRGRFCEGGASLG